MRIERIAIEGFGAWHETSIPLGTGLTVLVGDNEAGKTTLLAFVRAILFGFESNRYPALAGGRRGGALEVVTGEGRQYRVERHGDRGGEGQLSVRDDEGNERGPALLSRLLHGVEAGVYRNVFAFRLEELTEFRGLTEGDIAARIYGAGLGTGGASALAIEDRLRRESAEIFKPRGENPVINRLLLEIGEVDDALGRLDEPATYADVKHRAAAAEAAREEVTERIAEAEQERRRLERISNGWDAWIALSSATEAVALMPAADPLPTDAVERLARIESDLRAASDAVESASQRRRRLERQLAETSPDPDLLERRAEVRAVVAAATTYVAQGERLAAAREDLGVAAQRRDEALGLLGAGWDRERVAAFDTSVGIRAEIAGRFRDLLDSSRRDLDLAERTRRHAADVLERSEAELSDIDERLAVLRAGPSSATAADAPPRLTGPVVVAVAVAGLAAVLLVVAGWWPLAGVAAAGAAALVAATRWLRAGGHRYDRITARIAGLTEQRETLARRRDAAARDLETATQGEDSARDASAAATETWTRWLVSRGLDAGLDREAAIATIDAVVAARAAADRADDAARTVHRIGDAMDAFEADAASLLRALGRAVGRGRSLSDAVERLQDELQVAEATAAARARLTDQLDEARADEAVPRERLDRARDELTGLLAECGAADEGEVRRRAALLGERAGHEQRAAAARDTLLALSGPGPAVEELLSDLAAVQDISEPRDRLAAFRARIGDLAMQRDRLAEEIGGLAHEVRRLERSVEASELRQQRADLIARLESEAERWSLRALALALLERTRRTYEREHRPGVIRAAETLLASWTAGRYPRIVAPLGAAITGLERADGSHVRLEGLSRGTTEQLYLALRFGLVEHFAEEAEALPIVMDEILVNFDPARTAAAAGAIRDLAERHQVLYFTCHRSTAHVLDPAGDRTLTLS